MNHENQEIPQWMRKEGDDHSRFSFADSAPKKVAAPAPLGGAGQNPARSDDAHSKQILEEDKKRLFESLKLKLARGDTLSDKQQQVYQLLSRQFGGREGDPLNHHAPMGGAGAGGGQPNAVPPSQQNVAPRPSDRLDPPQNQVPVIQQPPNNELEEEVKDLVDPGGQPKAVGGAGEFDNLNKEPAAGGELGGAGGPNNADNNDDGEELEDGKERRNDPPLDKELREGGDNAEVRDHDGGHPPLDEPVAAAAAPPAPHRLDNREEERDEEDDYGPVDQDQEAGGMRERRVDNIHEDQVSHMIVT